MPLTEAEKEVRKLSKKLKELTEMVGQFLRRLDVVMSQHSMSPVERGKRVALLSNALEFANDSARYFELHINYHGDKKKLKPKHKFHTIVDLIRERDELLERLKEIQAAKSAEGGNNPDCEKSPACEP